MLSASLGLAMGGAAYAQDAKPRSHEEMHGLHRDAKAYIAMLSVTAGLKGDFAPASIFDFSAAAEASKEMAVRK